MMGRLAGSLAATLAIGVSVMGGCRDEPPPERFAADLGTPERPLLPTPAPGLDATILSGRGNIVPLPEPGLPANAGGETAGAWGTEQDRAAIAALVDAFGAAFGDRDADAAAALVVEEQRESLRAVLPEMERVMTAVEALKGAMAETYPAAVAGLETAMAMMRNLPFDDVQNLEFTSDTEAFLPLAGGQGGRVRFEKSPGGWLLEMPDLSSDAETEAGKIRAVAEAIQSLADDIGAGDLSPADIMSRLGTMMQAFSQSSTEPAAEPPPEP